MYGVRCNADRFYITQSSECKNALAVGYNTAVLFWMYSVSNASMILTIILNNFLAQASPFLTAYMYMYNPMHEGFRQLEFYGTHTRCAVVVAWKCMWDLKKTRVHHNTYPCTVEMECNSVDCIIISLYTRIYMDVDLMDCTEFFTCSFWGSKSS